jgi:hypothetical protein
MQPRSWPSGDGWRTCRAAAQDDGSRAFRLATNERHQGTEVGEAVAEIRQAGARPAMKRAA